MTKTIHFRQVEWFGAQQNLPQLLRQTLVGRPNVDDTVFQNGGETFEVRHRNVTQNEVRLHLAASVLGARRAVSPSAQGVPAADLAEAPPPQDSEYTEREMAIVARQDVLGYAASGFTRGGHVENALRGLLALEHGVQTASRLVLSAQADQAMVASLLEEGVDELDFGLVLPAAEAEEVANDQPRSMGEKIGELVSDEILTRITDELDDEEIDELEETKARLFLKLRKRKPTLEQVRNLTQLASEAVEQDEDFRIRTKENKTIFTREKLLLKSSFNHPDTPRLEYQLAWNETANFLDSI